MREETGTTSRAAGASPVEGGDHTSEGPLAGDGDRRGETSVRPAGGEEEDPTGTVGETIAGETTEEEEVGEATEEDPPEEEEVGEATEEDPPDGGTADGGGDAPEGGTADGGGEGGTADGGGSP